MALPAVTVAASAVLVRPMLPQFTVTAAVELLFVVLASTAAETVAVLLMLGQSPATVVRLSVTVRVLPLVSVPKLQLRVPAVIEQEPASVPPRVQVPAGSVSLTVTDVESPVPPALTRMVKVAVPPALTAALPVFWIETSGQFTVMVVGPAVLLPSLVVVALALLLTVPQLAAVVGELRCTLALPAGAIEPKLQVRTPAVIEQPSTAGEIVQLVPALVGRVSVTVTPVAVPVPLLVAVMV